jgi:hypothetical protein
VAKCFRTWTVLEHQPIEKLSDKIWSVDGSLPKGSTRRIMGLVKLNGERLLVHNAIALSDPEMAELERWGKPAYLVVPNGFHRQDAYIWKQRYPELRVLCPAGARAKVEQEVPVDGSYNEDLGDASVQLFHWRGSKDREGGVLVREADRVTLIVNDMLLNMPKLGGMMGLMLGPTGMASVPRIMRWMLVKDTLALKQHLIELSQMPGLGRILVGHGPIIEGGGAADSLKQAAARLS